jgi:hypothetical protein
MSSNPVADAAAKAAAEVAIKWTVEKVKQLAIKFQHRDVAFVEDLATIQFALKQRKTSEYAIFCENIADSKFRILFQLGLTLRGIETELEKCQNLRNTIIKKYGKEGLHIAQFVQNGIFARYYSKFLERGLTPEQLKEAIWTLFQHIDHTNSFVQANDNEEKTTDAIVSRINCYNPRTYSISGLRSVKGKVRFIASTVLKRIDGYSVEAYDTDIRVIVFLNRVEEIKVGKKTIKIKC